MIVLKRLDAKFSSANTRFATINCQLTHEVCPFGGYIVHTNFAISMHGHIYTPTLHVLEA